MSVGTNVTSVQATAWGDLAAKQLHTHMLLRVWEVNETSALLVGDPSAGEVVRLVVPSVGNGAIHVVIDEDARALQALRRGVWVWRVGSEVWFGDHLTLRLPQVPPWNSLLNWAELGVDEVTLQRRLIWLADVVLARAADDGFGGFLPELLATGAVTDRTDLDYKARLLRWRAGRLLTQFVPALVQGDLALAEQAVTRIAGLGPGRLPAGDRFLLGLLAGVRLWPGFLESTGLNQETVLLRLARTAAERTGIWSGVLLRAAIGDSYDAPWHRLAAVLGDENACGDERRQALEQEALRWMADEEERGSSALVGLLLPILWQQRGPDA